MAERIHVGVREPVIRHCVFIHHELPARVLPRRKHSVAKRRAVIRRLPGYRIMRQRYGYALAHEPRGLPAFRVGNQIDRANLIRLPPSAPVGAFPGHPFVDLGVRDGTRRRFGKTEESGNRQNENALAHALHSITSAALDSVDGSLTSFLLNFGALFPVWTPTAKRRVYRSR